MIGNWIYQTTTTVGSGNIVLDTVAGYPSISSQFAVGELFKYQILDDATGAPLEQGFGSINVSGDLVRDKPNAVMSGGVYDGTAVSALSLPAGTKRVIVSLGAQSSITSSIALAGSSIKGYGDAGASGAPGTISSVASLSHAVPFIAASDQDVDAIVVRVVSLNSQAAGGEMTASIWSVGANGLPSIKLAEASAIVSTAAVYTMVLPAPIRPPSRFFVVFTSEINYQFQSTNGYNSLVSLGFNNLLVPVSAISKAGTGSAPPSNWTGATEILTNTSRPQLICRCVQ